MANSLLDRALVIAELAPVFLRAAADLSATSLGSNLLADARRSAQARHH